MNLKELKKRLDVIERDFEKIKYNRLIPIPYYKIRALVLYQRGYETNQDNMGDWHLMMLLNEARKLSKHLTK